MSSCETHLGQHHTKQPSMGFAALNPSYMLWPYETHHLSPKLPPRFAQPHPAKRRWQVPCDETSRNVEYGPHPADMSMFHRIEVNLIDMACEIVFVSQGVFPMSALPNATLRFVARLAEIRSSWGSPLRRFRMNAVSLHSRMRRVARLMFDQQDSRRKKIAAAGDEVTPIVRHRV